MNDVMRAYIDQEHMRGGEPGSPIRFVAATEGLKADGMDLVMSGGQFERFRANPIVTWAHDLWGHRLPIGRAEVFVEGSKLMADISFDQEDEFAQQVESKYRNKFLHALSITWNTLKREGEKVEEWELIEIAAVPLPMDPDALMEGERKGLESLQRSLNNLFNTPGNGTEGEAGFLEVAVRMVRLFRNVDEFPEETWKANYKKLVRQYVAFGKEPPEEMSLEKLAAFGKDELRGLFLEKEFELIETVVTWPEPEETNEEEPDKRILEMYKSLESSDDETEPVDPRLAEIYKNLSEEKDND